MLYSVADSLPAPLGDLKCCAHSSWFRFLSLNCFRADAGVSFLSSSGGRLHWENRPTSSKFSRLRAAIIPNGSSKDDDFPEESCLATESPFFFLELFFSSSSGLDLKMARGEGICLILLF